MCCEIATHRAFDDFYIMICKRDMAARQVRDRSSQIRFLSAERRSAQFAFVMAFVSARIGLFRIAI
jgi:hypothetical protein